MRTSSNKPWIARTMLFVPAHREDLVVKAANSQADCIVLDLQDGTPVDKKSEARARIGRILRSEMVGRKRTLVRVNEPGTDLFYADLERLVCDRLDGVVCPLVNSPEDIHVLEKRLGQVETNSGIATETPIVALVETPCGVLNAHAIASSSSRITGLMFGAEDFMVEMESPRDADDLVLHTPRALVAMAARAAAVEAIDTPYVNVPDLQGLRRHAERGRNMGMSGILVLSPRQIEVAHAVFTPVREEVSFAHRVLLARDEMLAAGQAYALVDGELISPSREKRAKQVLARARAIREVEERA